MSLLEQLLGANNGAAIDQVSRQFGLDPAQARSAMDALLPTVAAGFQRSASAGTGLEGVLGAQDGNSILGQIFGSKDVSREVAARASAQTGIGPDILKAMLPMVATMVVGALAKGAFRGGAAQAGQAQVAPSGGGLLDMLTPMLDGNKDGNVVDDLMGMMGKHIK
jgi:hypothetical protein